MGSYAQWRRAADKGTVRRFTWICGTEQVLVNEIISKIWELLGTDIDADIFDMTPGWGETERDVWTCTAGYPADPARKHLVIVRGAQHLTRWQQLLSLIEHTFELRHLYLVLVSSEPSLSQITGDERPELAPHLAWLRDASQGQLVVCSPPNEKDLIAWTQRQYPGAPENLASHILTRCAGDLAAVRDVCAKARIFPEVSKRVVDELSIQSPGADLADALVAGDKRTALAAALEADLDTFGSVIGLLDSRLDMLATLHKATADGMSPQDMHTKLRLPQFVVAKYRRFAPGYTESVVAQRRAALALTDSTYRTGARDGIAEFLVALW